MNWNKGVSKKQMATVAIAFTLLSGDVLTSCKSAKRNTNKTQRGAAIGAAGGAAVGGIIGRRSGNTVMGAILGATVGGAAGAVIGRRMDKAAEEMQRDLPNAKVERVGEGIKITFGSDILFDVGKYDLKPQTRKDLADFAQTLQKYQDTDILVEGHADATGSDELNLRLSRQRADAVADYLKAQGVKAGRMDEKGYGESQPVADNDTEAGRQKNRRVDIAVFANDKMKRDAKNGNLD
ncbi:OmpA family protein [Rudanella lutea]|uniref:OmpA family protein n=1 Tax=Rudanella lutea TaxID=451374 RepID=UPI000381209C|nr:OmpA family protein [Rudanella lutea]